LENNLVSIRRLNIHDAPALSEISTTTFYDTFTGTCTEEDMKQFLEEYFNLQQVEKELSDENDLYFFAEVNGQPAGYLRLMEDYAGLPLMQQWKALELKRLYIKKEFHGKGIAQLLMDFTFNMAKEKNYEVIWLGVWEHNLRAQAFYKKYGFEDSGHTHDFPIGNTPQTDQWFWKFLI
jgi:ribosomal protein S18 acetylase RimI-like enzyme